MEKLEKSFTTLKWLGEGLLELDVVTSLSRTNLDRQHHSEEWVILNSIIAYNIPVIIYVIFIIKRTDSGDLYYMAYNIKSLFYFYRTWLKIVFRDPQFLFVVTCYFGFYYIFFMYLKHEVFILKKRLYNVYEIVKYFFNIFMVFTL